VRSQYKGVENEAKAIELIHEISGRRPHGVIKQMRQHEAAPGERQHADAVADARWKILHDAFERVLRDQGQELALVQLKVRALSLCPAGMRQLDSEVGGHADLWSGGDVDSTAAQSPAVESRDDPQNKHPLRGRVESMAKDFDSREEEEGVEYFCDGCAEKAQAESPVHLDEEGLPAITGSRYRRGGEDEWDLCQECFQRLSTEEQRNYRHCAPAAAWAGGSGDHATSEAVPPTRCRDEEEGEEVPASRDMGRQQEMWQPAPAPVQMTLELLPEPEVRPAMMMKPPHRVDRRAAGCVCICSASTGPAACDDGCPRRWPVCGCSLKPNLRHRLEPSPQGPRGPHPMTTTKGLRIRER
jgi:hypothetical protein